MGYTKEDLEEKILKMYPEIKQHGCSLDVYFDEAKDAWIVKLGRGKRELITHIEKKDAEECINGLKCIYLGVQIGQFIMYCAEEKT